MLVRGEIDLCITSPAVADPDLPSCVLYRDRFVCVARKRHPLKARRISLQQLCSFDHLLVDPTGRSLWGPVDDVLAALGHRRRIAAAVPSFHVLFELLQSDDFIAFVPGRLLRDRRSIVRTLDPGLKILPIEVMATWHPRVSDDARHKWVREVLKRVAGDRQVRV